MPTQLTEHFTFEELTFSETALRHNIKNVPLDGVTQRNLQRLAENLEKVRNVLGHPIRISSGYRNSLVNSLVGSKPTSAHVKALAADFTCPDFGSVRDVVDAIIVSDIQYDQVIWEFDSWCHIGFSDDGIAPRREALTINKSGTKYYP